MPTTNVEYRQTLTALPCAQREGERELFCLVNGGPAKITSRRFVSFIALWFLSLASALPCTAQTVSLLRYLGSGPAGLLVVGGATIYTANFGSTNALGIGTPSTGLTESSLSGGELYQTPYVINITGTPAGRGTVVRTYVSANTNPTILQAVGFYPGSSPCPSSGYSALPTSQAGEADILPIPGVGDGNYNACVGLIVNLVNGASAVAGTYSVTINFDVFNYQVSSGRLRSSSTTTLTVSITVQTAIQLLLAKSGSFQIVTTGGTPDFTANFGNVNALGIGPAAGLNTLPTGGGVIYWTPYLITPAFSSFASTKGTIQVYASTTFAHSALLQLNDSASSAGPYSTISTNIAAQTQISGSAASGSIITRYLGLFVSNINGPTSYRGGDAATLTYTLTVP